MSVLCQQQDPPHELSPPPPPLKLIAREMVMIPGEMIMVEGGNDNGWTKAVNLMMTDDALAWEGGGGSPEA